MSTTVLAAAAVIIDAERILLIQRGNPPQKGKWTLPGGKVNLGETLEEAVRREVEEETGYRVEVGQKLWELTVPTGDGRVFEIHDFAATVIGGALRVGDDAADARWIAAGELQNYPLTDNLEFYLRRAGLRI